MFFKSVQAGDFRLGLCVRKYLAFSNLPRMDSNHDKVIQSRFVRLRNGPAYSLRLETVRYEQHFTLQFDSELSSWPERADILNAARLQIPSTEIYAGRASALRCGRNCRNFWNEARSSET